VKEETVFVKTGEASQEVGAILGCSELGFNDSIVILIVIQRLKIKKENTKIASEEPIGDEYVIKAPYEVPSEDPFLGL
jgi:hypothetical protein